jgi:hypothetical protein
MLDGIVVNVIHVNPEVVIVPYGMFPEAFLPHPPLMSLLPPAIQISFRATICHPGLCEGFLDPCPARGKITIILRQFPYAVKMIRKKYKAGDSEGEILSDILNGNSQESTRRFVAKKRPSLMGYDRKGKCSTGDKRTTVIRQAITPPIRIRYQSYIVEWTLTTTTELHLVGGAHPTPRSLVGEAHPTGGTTIYKYPND